MELIDYHFTDNDSDFDKVFTSKYRKLSKIHWTPVEIIKTTIDWLELTSNSKVLDIGSGVGKFCLQGALLSKAQFTGVEKRKTLVSQANKVKSEFKIDNIEFIHANIVEIDFFNFNAFYYYNPFCEQIALSGLIDKSIVFDKKKYDNYEEYVLSQFDRWNCYLLLEK